MLNKEQIILIADPRILQIEICEKGEPLVNLQQQHHLSYGSSPEIPDNQDYTFVRKTVYDKLLQAQSFLPHGLRLCLYEGLRSLPLQKMLFEQRWAALHTLYPQLPGDKLFDETMKMVSPVYNKDGSRNTPPHSTGAAVDLYLLTAEGRVIDMGIHPADWQEDTTGLLSATLSSDISQDAKQFRQWMADALQKVGFVNYPTEYWHWSYGDRYWAYFVKEQAFYGAIDSVNSWPKFSLLENN